MRLNVWKVSTVALAGTLAFVVGNSYVRDASAEPQPHMKSALELLEKAKEQLQKATADKGGHRVKAIEHTNNAIASVKAGIEYDNNNTKK